MDNLNTETEEINKHCLHDICDTYKITLGTLSIYIGVSVKTLYRAAASNNISKSLSSSLDLFIKNKQLEEELKEYRTLKKLLKNILDD